MTRGARKGRAGGAAMMAWMFFANLFDPKKVAAMEHIDTQRRLGPEAHRIAATPGMIIEQPEKLPQH